MQKGDQEQKKMVRCNKMKIQVFVLLVIIFSFVHQSYGKGSETNAQPFIAISPAPDIKHAFWSGGSYFFNSITKKVAFDSRLGLNFTTGKDKRWNMINGGAGGRYYLSKSTDAVKMYANTGYGFVFRYHNYFRPTYYSNQDKNLKLAYFYAGLNVEYLKHFTVSFLYEYPGLLGFQLSWVVTN